MPHVEITVAYRGNERSPVVPAFLRGLHEVVRRNQRFGRLDLVVNNAGLLIPGRLDEIVASDLDAMLRVNLFGQPFVMQDALRVMGPQRDGVIVNIASLAGRRGHTPLSGYCATKFALVGFTEAVREELAGRGIHVALVLPGIVETPMVEQATHDQDFLDFWPNELNVPPSWVGRREKRAPRRGAGAKRVALPLVPARRGTIGIGDRDKA